MCVCGGGGGGVSLVKIRNGIIPQDMFDMIYTVIYMDGIWIFFYMLICL